MAKKQSESGAPAAVADERPAAEWVPLDRLTPCDANPRKNDKAVDAVANSIRRLGFGAPIVARMNGEVIAGHTRLKAAQKLGLDRVPVRFVDLDPADARLMMLADNKLGEIATWDDDVLASLLGGIGADDTTLAGFDEDGDEAARPETEVRTETVRDEFVIVVSGPLPAQADALDLLRVALEGLEGVTVDMRAMEYD